MKKMLIDAASNIMMFDGKKLELLGKSFSLREIISDRLYAFGNDLYLKANDEYTLFAQNARHYPFGKPSLLAENQFKILDNCCPVYISVNDGICSFPNSEKYLSLFFGFQEQKTPDFVAINNDELKHPVGIIAQNSELVPSNIPAIGNKDALFWRGGIYVCKKGKFIRQPIIIERSNKHYMIFYAETSDNLRNNFAAFADGTVLYLGYSYWNSPFKNDNPVFADMTNMKEAISTKNDRIIPAVFNGQLTFWNLEEDAVKKIIPHQIVSRKSYAPGNGSVYYHYRIRQDINSTDITDVFISYKLTAERSIIYF